VLREEIILFKMAYSFDSFRDFAIKIDVESRVAVVTDPVETRPSDAGSRIVFIFVFISKKHR